MYILSTKYGNVGIEATANGISKLVLNAKSSRGQVNKKTDKNIQKLANQLKDYFRGKKVSFNVYPAPSQKEISDYGFWETRRGGVKLDLIGLTDFSRKVLKEARKISFGKTTTYGEIAKRIGHPKASRAVGQALGANPLPIIIPCHRVIRKDKSLGGFAGGLKWKKILLTLEKIGAESRE